MISERYPTAAAAYDELLKLGVSDPGVVCLGGRWVAGAWKVVSEVAVPRLTSGPRPISVNKEWILPVGRLALVALGEGTTIDEAMEAARKRLEGK